ncbi:uncharacterized protein Z518_00458 [Rhinocladiella mackenziei CBS 650.93]|uniref:Rhinocladiella mackenziei CBS 650.93 unplaced genomic scaffold supercont1.1, whole genome shotgun sequence n=1 Tax=Rhinocladiella mackenziei CBS 650.93 TaxID=1442369 RepID=A0A0D2ITH3_9EURO|nr:uncharacterized protein Z518_00458 [Rhinocladiella mackenziei CBS 650.93]KIX09379.1 hypothetical protein Z518_00458 [Rhinocladiella mackenziei CBS 650.93]
MSRPPVPRSSVASGLAPPAPPPGYPTSMHGSGVFPPPLPLSAAPSRPQSRIEPPPLSATMGPMPGTLERPIQGPRKRLIVTCDGTWLDSDNGLMNGQKQPPSNVSRIGWAIKDTSRDGIPQIVNYQAGVGTAGGPAARVVGGATGLGLKENMREAYTYLAINWKPGDEIFLMGFSRGAFTARSTGGMIGALGLLTRLGLPYFNEIFEDWEHRFDDRYVSKFPNVPFPEKGPFDQRYVDELARRGLTTLHIPIKAICCWDTVGSLGIPRVAWLENLRLQPPGMHDYEFYDTRLHPCIENAFQALALDERRAPFSPALWEKRDNDRTNLVQVWFPGVHSNVGGGYEDQDLANITLAWMISKLEPFLDFRPNFLIGLWEENRAYYKTTGQKTRWWSFGELYNSLKGIYSLTGSKNRTPGNYYRTDPHTGRPMNKRLKNTNEYIHASVRSRLGLQGPGSQDRGVYDPPALRDWTFNTEIVPPGQGGGPDGLLVVWTNHSTRSRGGQDKIPEARLSETELVLLRQSSRVYDYVRNLRPPSAPREKRRSRRQDGMAPLPPDYAAAGAIPPPQDSRRSSRLNPNGFPETDEERRRRKRDSRDPDQQRRRRSRRHDD